LGRFKRHIFICVNERPPGHPKGCCSNGGSQQIRELFKKEVAKRGLKGVVRANKAGCLDACEYGPSVVVYPDEVWYGGVTAEDVAEIVDKHIIGGEVVERLRIPDSCWNKGS